MLEVQTSDIIVQRLSTSIQKLSQIQDASLHLGVNAHACVGLGIHNVHMITDMCDPSNSWCWQFNKRILMTIWRMLLHRVGMSASLELYYTVPISGKNVALQGWACTATTKTRSTLFITLITLKLFNTSLTVCS